MVNLMGLKKLYVDIYKQFIEKYQAAKGFDFQQLPWESTAPKSVTFKEELKWWTLNRPQRLKAISRERDRQQQEIIDLKNRPQSSADTTQS